MEADVNFKARMSPFERLAAAQRIMDDYTTEAETKWTPGQACWSILDYFVRIEEFTDHHETAAQVVGQTTWLARVLQGSILRAEARGLEAGVLSGISTALDDYNRVLAQERNIHATAVLAARSVVELEIAYVSSDQSQPD